MVNRIQKTLNRGFALRLCLIGAAFGSAGLAHHFAGDSSKMVNPAASVLAWFFGIALAILATYLPEGDQVGKICSQLMPRWEVLALLFLFIFALLVRVIAIGKIPPALSGDEASNGLLAVEIAKGRFNNPFITGWYRFPSLFSMLPAVAIALGGRTIAAIRIPSAIAGALTVMGVYGLGRVLFGRATGWASAILLAGLSYHIQFSRLGLNNIWDGLFVVWIFLLFWLGWHKGKRWYFIGTGVLVGLSQYFYVSGHIVPIIMLVWLASMVFTERQHLTKHLFDLLSMAVLAGVVFLPLVLYYIDRPNEFWEPMARVSAIPQIISYFQFDPLSGLFKLISNTFKVVFGFVSTPLISFYALPRPLLPAILVPFFVLGTGILLFHMRDARYRLLFFWGMFVIVINVLAGFPPAAQRYILGMPLAVLIAAIGLMEFVQWGLARWPVARWVICGAAILLALITIEPELHSYFMKPNPMLGLYSREGYLIDIDTVIAMRLAALLESYPGGTQVIFFGAPVMWYHGFPEFAFLVPQVRSYDVEKGAAPPELTLSPGLHALFVFLPHRLADVDQVERQYPGGVVHRIYSGQRALPLFYVYEITSP